MHHMFKLISQKMNHKVFPSKYHDDDSDEGDLQIPPNFTLKLLAKVSSFDELMELFQRLRSLSLPSVSYFIKH